jgi:STE24 endopeptidase
MAPWYDEEREARARAYERTQALLFLLRFALLFALAATFWMSGWSQELAAGLRSRFDFPMAGHLIQLLFVAVAVFGYEAVLFPLSVLADYSLEKGYGRLEQEFGAWLRGYLMTLLLEIGIVAGGFASLYSLMRFFPSTWWMLATAAYAVLVVGLGEWGPAQLLPRVRPPVPSDDAALDEELRRVGRQAGLRIEGVAWWNFEHQEELDDVRLTGSGVRRRAVFSEWAWRKLARSEQVFLAARQMAVARDFSAWVVQGVQLALAAGVFWGAAQIAESAAQARGLPGAAVPEAFPFLLVALFGLAAAAGVFVHAVARHMELRADRFALRHAGGAEVLVACLRQSFERAPFGVDAPLWQVLLLHRKPTARCRLARAGELPEARPPGA